MKFRYARFLFVLSIIIIIIVFTVNKIRSKNNSNMNNEQVTNEIIYYDTLKIGISSFDTVNPILTKNKEMININQLIYEPLVELDSEYKLNLVLAKEYAKTSATTYIVKINNDIKWSNNTEFSSEDVKYTIDLLKSTNNIYSENVKNILSVDVIDNATLKITLKEEMYFFEYNLIFPIMSKNHYEGENFFNSNKQPIGTGMYKISNITNEEIILEKNENYRNQDKINKNINKISITIFKEMGELYNSFKMGNIDLINTSSLNYQEYIGIIGYYAKEYKGRECDFLSFNCDDYLVGEKTVRQAINYAIDKDNIVSKQYNNKYYISNFVLDYGSYIFNQKSLSLGYNPEKSKEILENNGWVYTNNKWKKNGSYLELTISVNSSNSQRVQVAEIIKTQLENIGIKVYIKQLSDSQYKYALENKNYQILLTGVYNGLSPDLTYFYGVNNLANYKNETVLNVMKEVKNITEQNVLEEKHKELVNIVKDECPYISLYRNKNTLIINQNLIGNFEPTNYGIFKNFESWNKQ